MADSDGCLALHYAAQCDENVTNIIFEANPKACQYQDVHGRLPLFHFVCKNAGN